MPATNQLGRFIRECRASLGLTSRRVEELTRTRPGLTPISHSNLLALEKGAHVPTFDKIVTLSHVLNVPTLQFELRLRQDMLGTLDGEPDVPAAQLLGEAEAARDEGEHGRALELYLRVARTDAAAPVRHEAALQAAVCRSRLGLLRLAKDELEDLLGREDIVPSMVARAGYVLAETCRQLGNLRLALVHGRAALDAADVDEPLRAKILNTLGNILDGRGDLGAAAACYEQAIRLLERNGDGRGAATVLRNLGTTRSRQGEHREAAALLERGIELAIRLGDERGRAAGHANLARVHWLAGDPDRTREQARRAQEIAGEEGFDDVLFAALYYQWLVHTSLGAAALAATTAHRLDVLSKRLEARTVELTEWTARAAGPLKDAS